MSEYQKPYTTMFNAATDALEALEEMNVGQAREILRQAQQEAEELFLSQGEEEAIEGREEAAQ